MTASMQCLEFTLMVISMFLISASVLMRGHGGVFVARQSSVEKQTTKREEVFKYPPHLH